MTMEERIIDRAREALRTAEGQGDATAIMFARRRLKRLLADCRPAPRGGW